MNELNITNYPWLVDAFTRVSDGEFLHHGLLITGVSGIAKLELALALAKLLLCSNPGEQACDECRNCNLFTAKTHPDFHVLTTESQAKYGRSELVAEYCNRYQDPAAREKRANPSREILVDQVRLLVERFATHAHIANRKVALIFPADRMNANAANALLKLLEEPPGDAILILVSALPGYLPATVRSRCFNIALSPPLAADAKKWLIDNSPAGIKLDGLEELLSLGGPVDVQELLNQDFLTTQTQMLNSINELASGRITPLEWAGQFAKDDLGLLLQWLHRFSIAIIKGENGLTAPLYEKILLGGKKLSADKMFMFYDKVGTYRKISHKPINPQLALEELGFALHRLLV